MLEVDLLSSTVESVDVGFHRFANTGANSIIYKELATLIGVELELPVFKVNLNRKYLQKGVFWRFEIKV